MMKIKKLLASVLACFSVSVLTIDLVSCGGVEENKTGTKDGIKFELTEEGMYEVVGLDNYQGTELVIPTLYDDTTVYSIGEEAFKNSNITSVVIPDSITHIRDYAFAGLNIGSVELPKSINFIGKGVFLGCEWLTNIAVSEKNITYQSIDGNLYTKDGKKLMEYAPGKKDESYVIVDGVETIGAYAFYHCVNLESIQIPNGVINIEDSAFTYCGLRSLKLPEGVENIGKDAFFGCSNLSEVEMPDSVMNVGEFAFSNCNSLRYNKNSFDARWSEAYYLGNSKNPYVYFVKASFIENSYLLMMADGCKVIADHAFEHCEKLKGSVYLINVISVGKAAFSDCDITDVFIGDAIVDISECAFKSCNKLTNVSFGKNVEIIGAQAFAWCDELEFIEIPSNVKKIQERAFFYCKKLAKIRFNGTKAEWDLIEKGNEWNGFIPATKVVCWDGEYDL